MRSTSQPRGLLSRLKLRRDKSPLPKGAVTNPAGQGSPSAANHVVAASSSTPSSSTSFWERAYELKSTECPKLITGYQAMLQELAPAGSPPEQIAQLVDMKMKELEDRQLKLKVAGMSINLQEQFTRLVRTVIFAKDFIASVANADPHASLAWAGVSLLLPLLCRSEEQNKAMVDGIDKISSILCRYTVLERLYRDSLSADQGRLVSQDVKDLRTRFEAKAVDMLAGIIEYQARIARYCSGNMLHRYFRDVAKGDDWTGIVTQVETNDVTCTQFIQALDANEYSGSITALLDKLDTMASVQSLLIDIQRDTLAQVKDGFRVQQTADGARAERECLDTLWTTNYESYIGAIERRIDGTCQWFANHPQFLSWKSSSSGDVLWLSADPGCGKTVISKYLVEENLTEDDYRITCFFFFRRGNVEQESLANALCSMLHQICKKRPAMIKHILPMFDDQGKSLAGSVQSLWHLLLKLARDTSVREIVCVFDALDECSEGDRYDLIQRVTNLHVAKSTSPHRASPKFLITSRPYLDIERKFMDLLDLLPSVRLSAELETIAIQKEIDLVIDYRMQQIGRRRGLDPATTLSVVATLKGKGNRTYLWLKLVLENIECGLEDEEEELQQTINSISGDLYEAYEAILARSRNVEKATEIFHVMLAARRPFSTGEMHVALSIRDKGVRTEKLAPLSQQKFVKKIREICGLFIYVVDDQINFLHQTAREFLVAHVPSAAEHPSTDGISIRQKLHLPIVLGEAHSTVALVCLRILVLECDPTGPRPSIPESLLTYSVEYWDFHAKEASKTGFAELLCDLVFQACRLARYWPPKNTTWTLYYALQYAPPATIVMSFGLDEVLKLRYRDSSDPQRVAELNELDDEKMCNVIERRPRTDWEDSGRSSYRLRSTVLGWAICPPSPWLIALKVDISLVRSLLDAGADINRAFYEISNERRTTAMSSLESMLPGFITDCGLDALYLLREQNALPVALECRRLICGSAARLMDPTMFNLLLDLGFWPEDDIVAEVDFLKTCIARPLQHENIGQIAARLMNYFGWTIGKVWIPESLLLAMFELGDLNLALETIEVAIAACEQRSYDLFATRAATRQALRCCISRKTTCTFREVHQQGEVDTRLAPIYASNEQFEAWYPARSKLACRIMHEDDDVQLWALKLAIDCHEVEMLRDLLTHGRNIYERDELDHDALWYGIQSGNPEIVRTLLASGFPLDYEDARGRLPLTHAIDCGSSEVIRILLRAEPNIDLLIARIRRMTPRTHNPTFKDLEIERKASYGLRRVQKDGSQKRYAAGEQAQVGTAIEDRPGFPEEWSRDIWIRDDELGGNDDYTVLREHDEDGNELSKPEVIYLLPWYGSSVNKRTSGPDA